MQVRIFFLQELQACKLDPYRYIWQSICDQLPDKAAHPEVLHALVMRRKIRQAAEAAICSAACLSEAKPMRECYALQLASSTRYLIEETDRLRMNGALSASCCVHCCSLLTLPLPSCLQEPHQSLSLMTRRPFWAAGSHILVGTPHRPSKLYSPLACIFQQCQ